jgi:nucleoside-diphosphate-sugar epimerase
VNPVSKAIGVRTAMTLAYVVEGACRLLLLLGVECKPLLTRFLVSEMYTSHYFDISRAKNDLGYVPSCTVAGALAKTFAKAAPE